MAFIVVAVSVQTVSCILERSRRLLTAAHGDILSARLKQQTSGLAT